MGSKSITQIVKNPKTPMLSTGDLNGKVNTLNTALRNIKYSKVLGEDFSGNAQLLLPILHHLLLHYSPLILPLHWQSLGFSFSTCKDSIFISSLYSLLLQEFSYKPALSVPQFFSLGFAERKLIFMIDTIRLITGLNHSIMWSSRSLKSNQKQSKIQSNLVQKHEITPNELKSDNLLLLRNQYSPEAQKSTSPSRGPLQQVQPQPKQQKYHVVESMIYEHETESIFNHPPSRIMAPNWNSNYKDNQKYITPNRAYPQFIDVELEDAVYNKQYDVSVLHEPIEPPVQPIKPVLNIVEETIDIIHSRNDLVQDDIYNDVHNVDDIKVDGISQEKLKMKYQEAVSFYNGDHFPIEEQSAIGFSAPFSPEKKDFDVLFINIGPINYKSY